MTVPPSLARRLPHVALGLVLLAALALRLAWFEIEKRTPDEEVYAVCAVRVLDRGTGEVAEMVRAFNATPALWHYPQPTRVGHFVLVAATMAVGNDDSPRSAARLALLASLAALALLAALAWRSFGPWIAAIAVLCVAASPADLMLARRGWADGPVGALSLAMLGAAAMALRAPHRRRAVVLLGAAAAAAVVVKGSALGVVAVLALAIPAAAPRGARAALARTAIPALAAGALVAVAVLAAAAGGVAPLLEAFRHSGEAIATNDYVRTQQRGGPDYYLLGLWLLQPVVVVLGLAGAVVLAIRPGLAPARDADGAAVARLVALYALGTLAIAMAAPLKSLRFVSPMLGALALLAALVLGAAAAAVRPHPGRAGGIAIAAGAAALLVAAALDVQCFVAIFVTRGVSDLVTPWIAGR
jgi:4-amino-4-deoxy-L-arabinose transferase-like glycosyltransferase